MSDHTFVGVALPRPRNYINAHMDGRGMLASGIAFAVLGGVFCVLSWDSAATTLERLPLFIPMTVGLTVGFAERRSLRRDVRWSHVRCRVKGPLRFCRSKESTWLDGVIATLALVSATLVALVINSGNLTVASFETLIFSGLAIAGTVGILHSLFVLVSSAGLEVNARAVQKRTSLVWRTVLWEELEVVRVIPGRKPLRLGVGGTSGAFTVNSRTIGSDPNYVAMIIEYYRDHPSERYRLDDGIAAVRHVEEALAPLRMDTPEGERD